MKPTAKQNRELLKQYPFVDSIMQMNLEPCLKGMEATVGNLSIKVEKVDRNLMYRRASNCGLGDYSCIFSMKGSRKDQVMRRGEYAFAIGKRGEILNKLNFPRNDDERKNNLDEVYCWWVLWKSKRLNASSTGYLHSDSLWKEAQYIVWVSVEAWHRDTRNDDQPGARFGELVDRSMYFTIYSEPEEGFENCQRNANVYENLFLDTNVMTRGTLDQDRNIMTISGMLYEMCITFQDEVYFNGMKPILDAGKFRGASGQFGSAKVLAVEMCGYDRVMLEDAVCYVTFQLRPNSNHMYVLGQQGTLPQIRNLVRTVVRMWNQKPELREAFKPDKNVSVM